MAAAWSHSQPTWGPPGAVVQNLGSGTRQQAASLRGNSETLASVLLTTKSAGWTRLSYGPFGALTYLHFNNTYKSCVATEVAT